MLSSIFNSIPTFYLLFSGPLGGTKLSIDLEKFKLFVAVSNIFYFSKLIIRNFSDFLFLMENSGAKYSFRKNLCLYSLFRS